MIPFPWKAKNLISSSMWIYSIGCRDVSLPAGTGGTSG